MDEAALKAAFAQQIKNLRNAKGLSMDALAKLCGITGQRIYELELGKKIPRITTLIKIASGLGVSIFDIIDEPLGRDALPCAMAKRCPFYKPVKKDN